MKQNQKNNSVMDVIETRIDPALKKWLAEERVVHVKVGGRWLNVFASVEDYKKARTK